jgi:hypothetical protein
MFIQFLIEDESSGKLIDAIMCKYNAETTHPSVEYDKKTYKGIGAPPKGKAAINAKSELLLAELPKRLSAYNVSLKSKGRAAIFIVLDNDDHNTDAFRSDLEKIPTRYGISIDHVFCIAIEEIEAWLLGDIDAVREAYPEYAGRVSARHTDYVQDSICGTWEFMDKLLRMKNPPKTKSTYEVGKKKSEWAEKIGAYLKIRNNQSPSFQYFIGELDKRCVCNTISL